LEAEAAAVEEGEEAEAEKTVIEIPCEAGLSVHAKTAIFTPLKCLKNRRKIWWKNAIKFFGNEVDGRRHFPMVWLHSWNHIDALGRGGSCG
jgi:hypothetical protein